MSERVTAVVPTRNRCRYAAAAIAAVLAQRDVDLQLVVVDEGSTDDTPAYLADLAAREPRVTVLRHDPPRGLAGARNAGLDAAVTRWVAFCDDDDLWAPDKLAAQLAAIESQPGARWSCTGSVSIDEQNQFLGAQRPPSSGDISAVMRLHNAVPAGGSCLLVETDLLREVGGFDAFYTGCEDFEVAAKLSQQARVATVDRPLVGYRRWGGTMSTNVDYMRTGHERVLARWQGEVTPADARESARLKDRYVGWCHIRNGDRLAAASHLARTAVRYGEPRGLVSAGAMLVAPAAVVARRRRAELAAIPASWRAEVRGWLCSEVAVA